MIRGDDHVNNTPRQINIFRALGASRVPQYAHLPMILDEQGEKLSKRHGAARDAVPRRRLPADAMVNYLARLGWSPCDHPRRTR